MKCVGIACVIAPNGTWEHRFPIDCYRYFVDGIEALAKNAGFKIIESSLAGIPNDRVNRDWDDVCNDVCIVIKKENEESNNGYHPMFTTNRYFDPMKFYYDNYKFLSEWILDDKYGEYIRSFILTKNYKKIAIVGNNCIGKKIEEALYNLHIGISYLNTNIIYYPNGCKFDEGRVDKPISLNDDTLLILTILDPERINIIEARDNSNADVIYIDYMVMLGRIEQAIKRDNKVFIYGTGNNGKLLYNIMIENDFRVDGFIVSDEYYYDNHCCGINVYKQSKVSRSDNIILALVDNEKIMRKLKREGYCSVINAGLLC